MATQEEAKLQQFLQWLQLNKVELRGCEIKFCDLEKGFGIYSSHDVSDGILLVVPLDLAITPMRVLQEPILGSECRAMFEEGEVDDRFLMVLFLTVERLRRNSSWKPYLDMLPTTFGSPLWFSDVELLELKGTTLYRATQLQKKSLQSLFDDKVKVLVEKLQPLYGDLEREVSFGDFLWANSIFWTRALNIPLPHSYVFPQVQEGPEHCNPIKEISEALDVQISNAVLVGEAKTSHDCVDIIKIETVSTSKQGATVWVEGMVPGIDFCNHEEAKEFPMALPMEPSLATETSKILATLKASATWEVDGSGSKTGISCSMYLLSDDHSEVQLQKEISISYGDKGNEELLYLYGFVIDDNSDDYLMVNYPVEALQGVPFSDSKLQLLEAQKAELRCLLPRILLNRGFFSLETTQDEVNLKRNTERVCNYSWSGERKMPSYFTRLVFPEDFLTALRTIAMKEKEIFHVSTLLEELVGAEGERQPSDTEVRAAVWEACGDSGALQLLVDLLQVKMTELEEHSGTEDCDTQLLQNVFTAEVPSRETNESNESEPMSRKRRSSIIYRRGQKQLTRLFLNEAEHALQLALIEGN